jgi:hypothetical protein
MPISLNVETGLGLATSNSYVGADDFTYADGSVFGADTYFTERGAPIAPPNQAWFPPGPDDIKAACLIKASFFLDYYWRSLFKGQKKTQQQRLVWPRVGATIDEGAYDTAVVFWPGYGKSISTFIIGTNEIPIQVKMCVAELAARSAQLGGFTYPGELAPDLSTDNYVLLEKVGPIEVEYKQSVPPVTIFRFCEMLLAPIIRGSGGTVPLARG